MHKSVSVLTSLLLLGPLAQAQTKIASYAYGKPGTATYERLSFWVEAGKRTDIYYAYGAARKEVRLQYAGKKQPAAPAGFTLRFANGSLLSVVPSGTLLSVSGGKGAAKRFAWEYEGPVDGRGTFCNECAEDEKEAMQLVRTYYLK